MNQPSDNARRLESERNFHNERVAQDARESVHGMYSTIKECFADYRQMVASLSKGKRVLEYGCNKGEKSLRLAGQCSHIDGIDISDAAVQSARTEATRLGITNATFAVMDAEHLEFEDESFDMIFGSGIIHHLVLTRAYGELSRVLKRGGVAVFAEPLGHNPFINSYRDRTPELRTPDEHPLMRSDVSLARDYFDSVSCQTYGLATLAAVPVLKTPLAKPIMALGRGVDSVLLKVPGLKWWAWYSLLVFRRN